MQRTRKKALLSWSSGKDSAWALHIIRQQNECDVIGLVTTVNEPHARVAMHAVRMELLEKQAEITGIPLWKVPIPYPCTNEEYETAMNAVIDRARIEHVASFLFGDLFLEDIRQYRESKLAGTGIHPEFPLWGLPTDRLARQMIEGGLRAYITCIDPKKLPNTAAGRTFDESFISELPDSVDPCGERGEFHTFAYAGPMFHRALSIVCGDVVERDGFVFADLMLNE